MAWSRDTWLGANYVFASAFGYSLLGVLYEVAPTLATPNIPSLRVLAGCLEQKLIAHVCFCAYDC